MTASVERRAFGTTPDGRIVEAFTLRAGALSARVLTLGATLQALLAPDREGRLADVTLGHATPDGYFEKREYLGATVGRVANRIARGRFVLDGTPYEVPVDNGADSLHGGPGGWDRAVWEVVDLATGEDARVTLRHVSPDGDMGFPGRVEAFAIYALSADGALSVEYRATTDRPTIVNMTHHGYWNLAGEGASEGVGAHLLTVHADAFLPVDDTLIPTGEVRPVEGTAFDCLTPAPIGARWRDYADEQVRFGRGYDHTWVVSHAPSAEVRPVARLEDPASGRVMVVLSDQPGLQVYSANGFDGTTVGKSGRAWRTGDAVALEPQMFPDAPNRREFASVRLNPSETYRSRIVYRFTTN